MTSGQTQPFAIAYLGPRILRHVTRLDMTESAVESYLKAFDSLAADLQRAEEGPMHMLFDAREKSFAEFSAQKRISLGMRELLAPRNVGRAALVSTAWQGAGDADGVPSFDDIPSAWEHLTGNPCCWPVVSLVAGSTGAGKSTFARFLCRDTGAHHFSIDEWMQALYADDKPPDADFGWYMTRIGRIEALMRREAERLVAGGTPVVFDLGFTTREHRARWLEWAATHTPPSIAPPHLYFVDIPPDVRWHNVASRNRSPDAGSMHVTRDMFDFVESRFEPPAPDEADLAVVRW